VLPPLWSWEMVPFMVDQVWRAVSMVFSGRVNISFTHACTIKNSSSDFVFNSSLGHMSGPGALPGFRQCSTYFVMFWLVSAPRNLPCVPLAIDSCSVAVLGEICAETVSIVFDSLYTEIVHAQNAQNRDTYIPRYIALQIWIKILVHSKFVPRNSGFSNWWISARYHIQWELS